MSFNSNVSSLIERPTKQHSIHYLRPQRGSHGPGRLGLTTAVSSSSTAGGSE